MSHLRLAQALRPVRVRYLALGVLLAASTLGACAVETPAATPARASLAGPALPSGARRLVAMPGGAQLVVLRTISEAPLGGDGPTQLALGLVRDAQVVPVELPAPAVHAAAWGDDAVVLGVDGSLWRVGVDAVPVLVARDVVTEPALSDDGRVLAYVGRDGALAYALHLIDATGTHTIARDVPSAGALRFSPDGRALVFVGRSRGGVAGLHAISLEPSTADGTASPRCLTNCDLVTGRPWGTSFVPPPAGAAALRFEGDEVMYEQVRVAFRAGAP